MIGVFLSFVLYVPRAAQVQLSEFTLTKDGQVREREARDARDERLLLYNLEGEISFGAAPDVETHLASIEKQAGPEARVLVLFLKRARNPDAVCLNLLASFQGHLRSRNIVLILCGVRPDLAKALGNTGLNTEIGDQNIIAETGGTGASTRYAITRAQEILGAG